MDVDLENLRIDLPDRGQAKPAPKAAFWKILSLVLAVALVILAVFHLAGTSSSSANAVVETRIVVASGGSGRDLFTAGGWVEPEFPHPVVVSALVSGRMEKLNVVENSQVEKGQVIAELYKKDLEDTLAEALAEHAAAQARSRMLASGYRKEEVEQARAAAAETQARLSRLEAGYRVEEIEKAKAALNESVADERVEKSVLQRCEELLKKGAVSREELDKQKARYDGASARKEKSREALKLLEAGYRKEDVDEARAAARKAQEILKQLESGYRKEEIEEAQAQEARAAAAVELARAKLSYADITAPESGRILELHVSQGDYVTATKSDIASIYDPEKMQVRVDVRQENVRNMWLGQHVRVMTEARKGKPYEGEVIRIDPKANLARDTIRVKVRIQEPDNLLYPEMTATVDFLGKAQGDTKAGQGIFVPASAVLSEGDRSYVFVVSGGVARKTQVSLGAPSGEEVPVVSGLADGDEIAVSGVRQLRDGQSVRTQ